MTAFYKLVRTPKSSTDDTKPSFHYRFANQQTSRTEKVIHMASSFSSFSSGDIIGVLEVLKKVIVMELSSGHNVELKDFAFFSASLTGPPVYDRRKSHAAQVKFRTVKIRASANLKRQVRASMYLEKSPEKAIEPASPARRRKILLKHLEENKFITAKTYCCLTAVGKKLGSQDLKKYIEEGILVRHGNGPTTFYMRGD